MVQYALAKEELYAKHPDGTKMPDGTWRLKHTDNRGKIKFETFEEREDREAHNAYMRFSRTFDSFSLKFRISFDLIWPMGIRNT